MQGKGSNASDTPSEVVCGGMEKEVVERGEGWGASKQGSVPCQDAHGSRLPAGSDAEPVAVCSHCATNATSDSVARVAAARRFPVRSTTHHSMRAMELLLLGELVAPVAWRSTVGACVVTVVVPLMCSRGLVAVSRRRSTVAASIACADGALGSRSGRQSRARRSPPQA